MASLPGLTTQTPHFRRFIRSNSPWKPGWHPLGLPSPKGKESLRGGKLLRKIPAGPPTSDPNDVNVDMTEEQQKCSPPAGHFFHPTLLTSRPRQIRLRSENPLPEEFPCIKT